jgi:ribosomal protein S18 acetylase RimI-like enzyme
MSSISIESGGFDLLPKVERLWYELKRHQAKYAARFIDMSTSTFELRATGLKEKSKHFLVEIALASPQNMEIGYCFSTIDHSDIGELESLFINENYRRLGIGTELTARSLAWMEQHSAKGKRVSLFNSNESAMTFYRGFGFESRVQELMIPNKSAQQGAAANP